MNKIKIGVLSPLEGRSAQMGVGLVDSVSFVLERRKSDLNTRGIEIELVVKDDRGDPKLSLMLAKEFDDEDVICVIGPCDSSCAYEILDSQECVSPIISPLATATTLASLGAANFFRITTPDYVRAETLVRLAAKKYPNKCFSVYSFFDNEKSYSQYLKSDVIKALDKYRCTWHMEEFSAHTIPQRIPSHNEPAIFCSPSTEIVRIIPKLKERGFRSSIFTFGSNSNLLKSELVGTTVVADLDRNDTNEAVREEIERFKTTYDATDDPSISAMNCITLIINYLIGQDDSMITGNISEARNLMITALKTTHQRGLFGPITFTDTGELIGSEHLSVLQIASSRGYISFKHLPNKDRQVIGSEYRARKGRHSLTEEVKMSVNFVSDENINPKERRSPLLDIFISHSSEDKLIAEALIDLLRASLNISPNRIRCTSVDGYRLPVGAYTGDQLRQEVSEATVFIGLITNASVQSAYVLFELGARWGARLHLAPVLACGAGAKLLKGPLSDFNSLSCDVRAQIFQLVNDVAKTLGHTPHNPATYQKDVDRLYELSTGART
jgi:ABC-type branched-subunit amino acid transport system substrate-binding protein